MARVYILETKLLGHGNVSRAIATSENFTLYQLAEIVLAAYKFNVDHAFGFFSETSPDKIYRSKRKYELFSDMAEEGEDVEPTDSGSVKKTLISDVWRKVDDTMLFLFDYGDSWHFTIILKAVGQGQNEGLPIVLKSVGRAPKQYA